MQTLTSGWPGRAVTKSQVSILLRGSSARGGEEEHEDNGGYDFFALPLVLSAMYFLPWPSLIS